MRSRTSRTRSMQSSNSATSVHPRSIRHAQQVRVVGVDLDHNHSAVELVEYAACARRSGDRPGDRRAVRLSQHPWQLELYDRILELDRKDASDDTTAGFLLQPDGSRTLRPSDRRPEEVRRP